MKSGASMAILALALLVQVAEGISTKEVPAAIKTVQQTSAVDLEQSLVAMLRDSGNPALAQFVQQISTLLTKEMMPKVRDQQKTLQEQVKKLQQAVLDCNTGLSTRRAQASTVPPKIADLGKQHLKCRTEEEAAYTAGMDCVKVQRTNQALKAADCGALTDLENTLTQRPESWPNTCQANNGETFEKFTSRLADFYGKQLQGWKDKKGACDGSAKRLSGQQDTCKQRKASHETKRTSCDKLQSDMDAASCAYYDSVAGSCKTYDTCYSGSLAAYNTGKASIEKQEKTVKAEFESILRMECLIKAFIADDETAAMQACHVKSFSTDAAQLSVTYPYPPAPVKQSCPVPLDTAGTAAYAAANYAPLPANAPAAACTASCCIASKSAPEVRRPVLQLVLPAIEELGARESTCTWWGDPHFTTFGGRKIDFLESGKFWVVKGQYVSIQGDYCKYGSPQCRGPPSVTAAVAVGGPFLEGHTLIIQPTNGRVLYDGKPVDQGTSSWRFRDGDNVALNNEGARLTVTLPLLVRMVVTRYGTYMDVVLYMRPFPGGQDGHCGQLGTGTSLTSFTVAPADNLFASVQSKGAAALVSLAGNTSSAEAAGTGGVLAAEQAPPCTGQELQEATRACEAGLPAEATGSDRSQWLSSCIFDVCATGATKLAERSSEAFLLAETVKQEQHPLSFTVVGPGQLCGPGLRRAAPSSEAERQAVAARLVGAPANSQVCQPAQRLYRIGALTTTAQAASACSTGLGAMQLAVLKTGEERQAAQSVAFAKAGTTRVWLGGSFAGGAWVWADGSPITSWPGLPLGPADAAALGNLLCMACDPLATSAAATCPWVACGGAAGESHNAICESKIA